MPNTLVPDNIAQLLGDRLSDMSGRKDLCVKLIDKRGRIAAVNESGAHLLRARDPEELCGLKWSEMWQGKDRTTIEMAVAAGFMGDSSKHRLEFDGLWEIEICPLVGSGTEYQMILAVSRLLVEADAPDRADEAREELQQMAASAAHLSYQLERDWSELSSDQMANLLGQVADTCKRAVREL